MPKVSVCIPTYNSARYLGAAIDSAMAQEFDDYELIICDNASTDETPELRRRYTDPRIRYERFEELVGQAANWNRCLTLAEGDYIVLLHADDVLLPAFLRLATAVLDERNEVGLVHVSARHIEQGGEALHLQKLYDENRIDKGEVLLRRLLLEGCVVNPAGVMVRRRVYEEVGKFTEQVVWGVDWHMWMRIALRSDVAYLAEPLALYRQHSQSGTSGVMATARNGKDEMWMMNDLLDQVPADRADIHALRPRIIRQVAHRTWCFAEDMCKRGFGKATRAGVRRAIRIQPSMIFDSKAWALWAASYLGYDWFTKIHGWKRRIAGRGVDTSNGVESR